MADFYDKYGFKENYILSTNANNQSKHALKSCKSTESFKRKDLCEFNFKDFKELIEYLLKNNSADTVSKYISHYKKYLDYCNKNGVKDFSRAIIKKEVPNVVSWLKELSEEDEDYTDKFITIEELINLEGKPGFTYQKLAVYWLFFIGFKTNPVLSFKSKDIGSWTSKLSSNTLLEESLKNRITRILQSAASEHGMTRKTKYSEYFSPYTNMEYLIRSDKSGENRAISVNMLYSMLHELEEYYSKNGLEAINLNKSGMLYFGSEVIKNNKIETLEDLHKLVYYPICNQYGIQPFGSAIWKLARMFSNPILKKYYDVELPNELKNKCKVKNNEDLNSFEGDKFIEPLRREDTDKKPWEENRKKGEGGELLVLKHINEGEFPDSYLVKDCYGYDIYAKNEFELRYIEVKTMQNKRCAINITQNEYRKAEKYQGYYWIYLLVSSEKTNSSTYELFLYRDFFSLLGLRDKEGVIFKKESPLENEAATWTYSDFKLYLSDKIFENCDEYLKINGE